jgi:excinuclease ABC subunit C
MDKKTVDELREKANRLPTSPGVYIMHGADDKIIYIGKSKSLKNRVTQYFTDSEKNIKTSRMVASVCDFEYMLTDTEIEALVLENQLIKLHKPKYNILLKDAKSYPYIKVSVDDEYPTVSITRKRASDKCRYFGPYSGSTIAWNILQTARKVFMLPACKLSFPRDIGKKRPCIYSHIGQCCAPCSGKLSSEEYKERFSEIISFLRGNLSQTEKLLSDKMKYASENLQFEAAALYRDRIKSIEMLRQKQRIVGNPDTEYDVFSLFSSEMCSCLAVYYVREGAVIDSDNFIFSADKIADTSAVISLIARLYSIREYIPQTVLLGFDAEEDQISVLSDLLSQNTGKRISVKTPKKGELRALCDIVTENAALHAKQYLADSEKDNDVLVKLAALLGLEVVPENIESIDISNFGNDNITAGIISVQNGKFKKSAYRTYKIKSTSVQDDYKSMCEALERRLSHSDENPLPDLYLLDGGKGHVSVVKSLFAEHNVDVPVFGMVKDDFHKTRALTDGENEISIAREQSVFMLIYKIQEEVHRFTISTMKKAKSKTVTHSKLENIKGIGPSKARALLLSFGTINSISNAEIDEISAVKGISKSDAEAIYSYFHLDDKKQKGNP